jgi:hypothetical protein
MLSIADMELLRGAYSAYSELTPADAMRMTGNPPADEVVERALAGMADGDRNRRVLMLRILQHQRGGRAMSGVLAGLNDEARRVCAVAIQASGNYLAYPEIVARLEAIVGDATLKRKLRRRALSMLAGDEGRQQGDLTAAAFAALTELMKAPEYRFSIVFGLARLELTPRVKRLLERFARSQDGAESALAQRALGGERVIHIDACAGDESLRRRIAETCDIAYGRMYYWLPRTALPLNGVAVSRAE